MMHQQKSIACFIFVILTAMLCADTNVFAADVAKPNILLIMADDVGSDAIGCYGGQSYPTPHIDALAAGGLQFNQAFAMPVCHPSRVCLMTGRYPFRFGKEGFKWGDFPNEAEGISIGDRMKEAGYATAVAGKWQLCMMKNDLDHPRRVGFDEWCLFGWHEGGRYHDPLLYQNGKLRDDTKGKYGPDLYVEFLIDFMKQSHQRDKPFFVYYSMALCHDVTDDLKGEHVAFYKDGRWLNYAEMMSSMDDMVGRLTQAIDDMGVRRETLILFTTDNGTAGASYLTVNQQGKMVRPKVVSVRNGAIVPGGKGKHDDTGTRVPLIANWPGTIKDGVNDRDMIDLTDYSPTVADIAGLKAETDVPRDGISFAPLLVGGKRTSERPWVFCEHRGKRSIRSLGYRLYDNGRLFDLTNDPQEKAVLKVPEFNEVERREFDRLQRVLGQMKGPIPNRGPATGRVQ